MAYKEKEIQSIFKDILTGITKGKALRNILKDGSMPSTSTFYNWLQEDESKSKQYARATELRAENIFEDILDIADNNTSDIISGVDGERTNNDVIQRSRLMVDARKWYLSKLNPKKYGDKIETTIEGGEKPVNIVSLGNGVKPD